ncbi:MAG: peroxiredoxin [Pseudomonadota bacterium]
MTSIPHPELPPNLPVPVDDGACDHLVGLALPPVTLTGASGRSVDMAGLGGLVVMYLYPMSGKDDAGLPDHWDAIPGARGCTPQACAFRDHHRDLAAFGASVFGLATQSPAYLAGEIARLHLPYDLLSDENLAFQSALSLPLFEVKAAGRPVLRRVTLICRDARIIKVFYPVFPPHHSAAQVLDWLATDRSHQP